MIHIQYTPHLAHAAIPTQHPPHLTLATIHTQYPSYLPLAKIDTQYPGGTRTTLNVLQPSPFLQIPKQHYKSQNHNSLDVRNDQVRVGDRVAENGTSMLARIVFGVLLDW
jgi:hypothetical protein